MAGRTCSSILGGALQGELLRVSLLPGSKVVKAETCEIRSSVLVRENGENVMDTEPLSMGTESQV